MTPKQSQPGKNTTRKPAKLLKVLVIGQDSTQLSRWRKRFENLAFDFHYSLPTSTFGMPGFQIVLFLPMVNDERESIIHKLKRRFTALRIVMLYDVKIEKTELAHAVLHSLCELHDLDRALHYVAGHSQAS